MKSFQLALMASVILLLPGLNSGGLGAALQADTADSSADNPIMELYQQDSSPPLLSDGSKNWASPSRIAIADWRNFTKNYVRNGSPPDSTTQVDESLPQRQPVRRSRDSQVTILASYTEHDPIFIWHNDNFTDLGFLGAGTDTFPYRIEGLNITNTTGPLIEIRDTTAYFNISGNLLDGLDQAVSGILLVNVTQGIINNNFLANTTAGGVRLDNSTNNRIANNMVYNNTGIALFSSSNNTIANNTVHDSYKAGIYCRNATDNTISHNKVYDSLFSGIIVHSSDNNTIANNEIAYNSKNGIALQDFGIGGSQNNTIVNNTVYNNGLNGINLDSSNNNTIANNTVYNCATGIGVVDSDNTTISHNSIFDAISMAAGIGFVGANYARISNNTIYNSENGIALDSSTRNTIANNTVYNCATGIGVVDSDNTTISHNSIFDATNIATGIYFVDANYGRISNNTIYNYETAIGLDSSAHNAIINNVVFNITGWVGIHLGRSHNNTIADNTVFDNAGFGISPGGSNNTVVANNSVYNCEGIGFWGSNNTVVANNTIFNVTGGGGIHFGFSDNNTISNNTIFDCDNNGIHVGQTSNNNVFSNNTISNCQEGIAIYQTSNNSVFSNNTISNCQGGIAIYDSGNNNVFSNNTIHDNNGEGISLGGSTNNMISYNSIYGNDGHGINVGGSTHSVEMNDLSGNNPGGAQASDDGSDNVFINNYWSDWNGLGSYAIDGSAGNQDPSPLVNPYHLSAPLITAPTPENLTLSGVVSLHWNASRDAFGHSLTYAVYYSTTNGTTWTLLASGLTTTTSTLDTTPFADGTAICFRVEATDSGGFIAKTIPEETFYIWNTPHQLSPPALTFPTGGETLSGTVDIVWRAAEHTWAHTVTYTLYYSTDGGTSWSPLATNLTATSYAWETSTVTDGTNYLLKVNATCTGGLSAETVSLTPFTVHNAISVPTIASPNGGETLQGTVTIEWAAAVDSANHAITYAVYSSSNEGVTWTLLASGLTATSYSWDTTTGPNGLSYLVKVVTTCSEGGTTEDVSDGPFAIQNGEPTTTSSVPSETTPALTGLVFLVAIGTMIALRDAKTKLRSRQTRK
ncbi:MAG: right-handed parallel beta-helix repeat-containing protein [Candidatus Hodarchaeales archaeon]|jgi:parallel beta-helix repeat protein